MQIIRFHFGDRNCFFLLKREMSLIECSTAKMSMNALNVNRPVEIAIHSSECVLELKRGPALSRSSAALDNEK